MEFKNPALAIATLAATAATLLSIKTPFFPVAALVGASTGGYLAASYPGSQSRSERKNQQWQADLDSWQKSLDEKCDELFEQTKVQALQAAESEFVPKFEQSQQYIDQQLQLLNELKHKAQEKWTSLEEREKSLKALADAAQESEIQLKQEFSHYQQQTEERVTQIEQYYRNTYGAIAGQFASENRLLKTPDHTDGSCNEELLADRVIDVLASHGIVVKQPIVKPNSNGFTLAFKILPKLLKKGASLEGDPTEQLLSIGDALKIISNQLLETLKASVPGCRTKPTVEAIYEGISLGFDTSGIDHEERTRLASKSSEIDEPPEGWFEKAVSDSQHIRVTGERDSGKSTLVSNIVDLKLVQNPGCQIKLCNPLYGSRKDRWNIPATWKSFDEALDGLGEASGLIYERNKAGREAKDAGESTPEFEPILYIFDEIDTTVSVHGKDASDLLKSCLTKGTHYNVHIIYLGQSPLCSTLKLNRPDFNHSTNFHLGQNIGRAIDDSSNLTESTKHTLRRQYELRQDRGDKFVLYCDYGKNHFLAPPPTPDMYKSSDNTDAEELAVEAEADAARLLLESLWNKESSDIANSAVPSSTSHQPTENSNEIAPSHEPTSQIKCPKCESLKVKKNGKKNGKQYYQCRDCRKNFAG